MTADEVSKIRKILIRINDDGNTTKIRFQAYVANNKFAIFLPILLYMYFVCHEQD